jgi:6-pyruvoyl-tetrahydropterin synthase
VQGEVSETNGWVVDFGDIKATAKSYVDQLDHTYLNDIEGLENPTSENIAIWLWGKLDPQIRGLSKIVVKESPTSGAVYTGK